MQIRKFTAPDMRQALAAIKQELGPDAVVVATRRVRGSGLLGPSLLEVTAATDDGGIRIGARALELPAANGGASRDTDGLDEQESGQELGALRSEVRELRRLLSGVRAFDGGGRDPVADRLVAADVAPDIAARLVTQAARLRTGLEGVLTLHLGEPAYRSPQGPSRLALVGPTGVGKTTTIAKLAAEAALARGLRVALVTLDTYRVGAIEQLRQFANLMRVPLEVARDAGELTRAVEAHRAADLTLIDTAGRNPGDERQVPMLADALGRAGATVHLTLAAATRRSELRACLDRYLPLSPRALLFTKLDEAVSLGALVNARAWCALPLSYITFGQRVPEDIARAHAGELASRLARPLAASVASPNARVEVPS
jgi:flagellar biosynthesis protein FlhF